MKATALRTGYNTYAAEWDGNRREVRYVFLMALVSAGYTVRIDHDGWRQGPRREVMKPPKIYQKVS